MAPIDEMLRQAVLHLDDLREIGQTTEGAGLIALTVKGWHGRLATDASPERVRETQEMR